jgi:cbb3-type cytochrome oxidase subunit 3
MTITIDLLFIVLATFFLVAIVFVAYERGQRTAWEAAENLYAPLLDKIADRTISAIESEEK